MKNPWLGLSSYTENSLKDYQFNGRSAAIASLASLIRQNLFVTLYGRSGIGKTSLLQAGVYPILRCEGFCPVTIRLNNIEDDNVSLAEIIWRNILDVLQCDGFEYQSCAENDIYSPDFKDILVFRKLFSAGRFVNNDKKEVIPVIVFDQFEEILYKAPDASRLLISQLYALIDDNYNLTVSHPDWHDDTNFRIVVSIREDDLFLFEDIIDSLNFIDLKSNRYRLMPLSDSEAKEVILRPIEGEQILEEGKEELIANEIIKLSKGSGQNVNTLLLSLICYILYNESVNHHKYISIADLGNYKDIIETYYKEVTKNIPKEQRYYLEDHLIDDQGRRTSIYLSDLEKYAPQAKQLIDNSNHRLLNENQGRVEFIHDQLAASVFKLKNSRKSRKAKQLGVLILLVILSGLFLFSFSRIPDVTQSSLYTNAYNLINETEKDSVTITNDSKDPYYIADCPSLKSINIQSREGDFKIYNCPSLVNIGYPEDFAGSISVLNCPYVDVDGKLIREEGVYNDIEYKKYKTHYPLQNPLKYTPHEYDSIRGVYFNYDSINHKIIVNYFPVKIVKNGIYKITAPLTDSIKRITDCYVPYGYKDKFICLTEYLPFHSIRESPVYYNWRTNIRAILGYFKSHRFVLILAILGLLTVQCFFWLIAVSKYKARNKNGFSAFALSFFYGLGMSLMAALSFMAFYWTVYNIILPCNQLVAGIVGIIGCLICMFFVYKNSFYTLKIYLKNHSRNEVFKNLKNFASKNSWNIIATVIMILLIILGLYYYSANQKRRENYLYKLVEIRSEGEYVRAASIIRELEEQHISWIYPSYSANLESLKNGLPEDSIYLYKRITPEFLNKLEIRQNIPSFSEVSELLAFSEDLSKLVVCVKYCNDNNLSQAVLVNLNNQSIDTLTNKTTAYSFQFKGCFSPSGKVIAVSNYDHLYISSPSDKTIRPTSIDASTIRDIMFESDSTFYYTNSEGDLFKFDITANYIRRINSPGIKYDLTMISSDLIGGRRSEIIIYNTCEDSVYFHSQRGFKGSIRSINKDYAVTDLGLFDIKNDSMVRESNYLYDYKGKVVECIMSRATYSFHDLDGNEIVKITAEDGDILHNISFSKDGNFIINKRYNSISIYSITPIAKRDWVISDEDKKFFDLK